MLSAPRLAALFLLLTLGRSLASQVSAPVRERSTSLPAVRADSSIAVRVWVNTASGVYHCPGTRYYGATKAGGFISEAEARAAGHRPAYGRTCTPRLAANAGPGRSALSAAAAVRVWVNTSSGVYHCPDSRYYGATKQGRYMTEGEARANRYRPAYNRACS
jgi:hypothetical protein